MKNVVMCALLTLAAGSAFAEDKISKCLTYQSPEGKNITNTWLYITNSNGDKKIIVNGENEGKATDKKQRKEVENYCNVLRKQLIASGVTPEDSESAAL